MRLCGKTFRLDELSQKCENSFNIDLFEKADYMVEGDNTTIKII
jgi:hypothetical protein